MLGSAMSQALSGMLLAPYSGVIYAEIGLDFAIPCLYYWLLVDGQFHSFIFAAIWSLISVVYDLFCSRIIACCEYIVMIIVLSIDHKAYLSKGVRDENWENNNYAMLTMGFHPLYFAFCL